MTGVRGRVYHALWRRFTQITGVEPDKQGYLKSVAENLIPGVTEELFLQELSRGSGGELDRKFLAVHSSSALAVNTFAFWKRRPQLLQLGEETGFAAIEFERKCPTGLRGTPPNLDLVAEKPSVVIGVESKLTEYFERKQPDFSPSYRRGKLPRMEKMWRQLLQEAADGEPQHLDIAQLIKHYLGLRATYPGRQVALMYLYWEPTNADEIPEFARHREEIRVMQGKVRDSKVTFKPMTYCQLWKEWEKLPVAKDYVKHLKERYSVAI